MALPHLTSGESDGSYPVNDLLRQAVNGSERALCELFERYGPSLRRRFSQKIPKRWQSVLSLDDLMQETFTDAFLHITDFEPRGESAFESWLATIARHNLINVLEMLEADKRGGQRRRVRLVDSDAFDTFCDQLGDTNKTPSGHAAKLEACSALKRAMAQLQEDHRNVVQLYDLECRSAEEVSRLIRRSNGAMFMLRARAHRALRQLMGTASDFLSDCA
ncbi:MAG: RNA polymerase sigma factor [Planctomycetota bacterium]|nr:RNA polymerase sigma factor [Planctomycetota bacterium]